MIGKRLNPVLSSKKSVEKKPVTERKKESLPDGFDIDVLLSSSHDGFGSFGVSKKQEKVIRNGFRSVDGMGHFFDEIPYGKTSCEACGGVVSNVFGNDLMRHYEGVLGVFDYDVTEFALGYKTVGNDDPVIGLVLTVPVLLYIGDKDVDIVIPDGVVNGNFMFAERDTLLDTPKLPKSMKIAVGMFQNCKNLQHISGGESYFSGLEQIPLMFSGCESLKDFPIRFPKSVKDCDYIYAGCPGFVKKMRV